PDDLCHARPATPVRLQPPQGREAHAAGAQRGQGDRLERHPREGGARCLPPACGRALGHDAAGLMTHGVQALPGGNYAVELEPREVELLRSLAGELEVLVGADDPGVSRLFPSAYRDDPQAEREYRRLVRQTLVSGRLEALGALRRGAGSK